MRITRFLLPGCVLALWVSPLLAQPSRISASPPAGAIPSVVPVGAEEYSDMTPVQQRPRGFLRTPLVRPASAEEYYDPTPVLQPPQRSFSRLSLNRPTAASNLEEITAPPAPRQGDPVGSLTGQPLPPPIPQYATGLPPGSYPSPYYTDGPGCCGPLGRNGQIGCEVYSFSGVDLPFGEGLGDRMNAGWVVGGGARTLLFTPTHTAAWVFDLGVSYTHNWAAGSDDASQIFLRQPPVQTTNPVTGQPTGVFIAQPDRLTFTGIREVHRTSFNFALGRDVWLLGSGNNVGARHGTNLRVGAWVGGRYGSAHVDLIPLDQIDGYSRRQNVFEGVNVGGHVTFEVPLGGWIFFGSTRAEYGKDWTNLVPPLEGNIQYFNILFSVGLRY